MSNNMRWNKFKLLSLFIALLTMSEAKSVTGASFCTKDDRCVEPFKNLARYDHYRIYNVELDTEEHVHVFKQLEEQCDSMDFIGHAREVGQKLSILVAAHKVADLADLLEHYKVKHRILTYNFQEKIDKNYAAVLPVGTDLSKFDWYHYYHLETIYEWLDSLVKKYPNVVTMLDMGTSTKGVPIKGIKISHNTANKAVFIEAGIHAREWIAPAAANYIINQLLTSTEENVVNLAKNFNWIIFPSINPDGYKYTFEHNRMWRKNRQLFGINYGVDLNRNYPDHWNSTGSSSDARRFDFAGPSAASEVETQRVVKFIEDNVAKEQIKAYLALHSYSQMIMFPFGYTKDRVANYGDLKELGQKATEAIKSLTGKEYVSGSIIETIYPSSGGSMDWAYEEHKIPIAYTFELRGPPDSQDMFILPAEEILPTSQEAFAAIKTIVEGAAAKGYFK
ncbi:zinc carboxypeptidase [Stomoxys calcitrans]|uniref:zinc carboxypeptidase n=1 Tax=Stomoxys calcitrans TaxID=35570 RepID=UPI0027E2F5C4|nr:zinc carboxypeptidase [Stomoxys calcitrans]